MYAKTVYVYSRQERNRFHSMGIWIDKNGYQIPVSIMSVYRLERLVKTLGTWALKEDEPQTYLKSLAIYPHVVSRIYELGLNGTYANLFKPLPVHQDYDSSWHLHVQPPSPDELVVMDQEATNLLFDLELI